MSPGLVLNRLEFCEHGQIVGTELFAAGHGVVLAVTRAMNRGDHYVLPLAELSVQAAGMDNADDKSE